MVKLKDGNATYDISDINTVNANDAQRDPNGIYLDFDREQIPDLNQLTIEVINFLEYIGTTEIEELEINDNEAFVKDIENKFPEFTLKYVTVYKMLLDKESREENLIKLLNLIEILKNVQSGNKNLESEFNNFKESLAEEYVYPKFGGKENFEKKIKERAEKKQRKKFKKYK